jgi:hypothetical protein
MTVVHAPMAHHRAMKLAPCPGHLWPGSVFSHQFFAEDAADPTAPQLHPLPPHRGQEPAPTGERGDPLLSPDPCFGKPPRGGGAARGTPPLAASSPPPRFGEGGRGERLGLGEGPPAPAAKTGPGERRGDPAPPAAAFLRQALGARPVNAAWVTMKADRSPGTTLPIPRSRCLAQRLREFLHRPAFHARWLWAARQAAGFAPQP